MDLYEDPAALLERGDETASGQPTKKVAGGPTIEIKVDTTLEPTEDDELPVVHAPYLP